MSKFRKKIRFLEEELAKIGCRTQIFHPLHSREKQHLQRGWSRAACHGKGENSQNPARQHKELCVCSAIMNFPGSPAGTRSDLCILLKALQNLHGVFCSDNIRGEKKIEIKKTNKTNPNKSGCAVSAISETWTFPAKPLNIIKIL